MKSQLVVNPGDILAARFDNIYISSGDEMNWTIVF